MFDIDSLAQEIRRVDGAHSLGAAALAEAIMPFLRKHGPALLSRADGGEAPRAVRGMPPFGQMGVPEQ